MYDIFVQLCERKGVSSYKVCKDLGISQGTISNWKNRGNNISAPIMKKIADYFDVSMEYLMGSENNSEENNEEYYEDKETANYTEFLHKNPEYKILFDAVPNVKKEDIQKALKAIGIFFDED